MASLEEKAASIYATQRAKPIIASIIGRIDKELSSKLAFHHARHTESVLRDTILFGVYDGLSDEDLNLLSVAAAFHDSGYLTQRQDHENISAQNAQKEMMASGDYSTAQVAAVASMICDTKVQDLDSNPKRISTHPLSAYLLDADLGNFGRDDFWECTEAYRMENKLPADAKYYNWLLQFMDNHVWLTPAAAKLRAAKENENRQMLLAKIGQMTAASQASAK
jgi:predicted metal-dependent HD superfamily phosphohydrolase